MRKPCAIICKFLDRPVKAIVAVDMHSLLEQTDSTVYIRKWGPLGQEYTPIARNLVRMKKVVLVCANT